MLYLYEEFKLNTCDNKWLRHFWNLSPIMDLWIFSIIINIYNIFSPKKYQPKTSRCARLTQTRFICCDKQPIWLKWKVLITITRLSNDIVSRIYTGRSLWNGKRNAECRNMPSSVFLVETERSEHSCQSILMSKCCQFERQPFLVHFNDSVFKKTWAPSLPSWIQLVWIWNMRSLYGHALH